MRWRSWLWSRGLRPLLRIPYRWLLHLRWATLRPSQDPTGKKRILFCASNVLMAEYVREIYHILRSDTRLEVYLTSSHRHQFKGLKGSALAKMVDVPFVSFATAGMQWWDLIIFPTPNGAQNFHPRIPKILCTHHTTGGDAREGVDFLYGPHAMRNGKCMFEKIFEASEHTCDIVERNNPVLVGRMTAVGDLKVDKMLRLNDRRNEIRRELGYQDNDIVVLLQSTWGEDSLIERMGRELVSEAKSLLPLGKYKFIISIHPNYWGTSPYAIEHPWGTFCEEQECEGLIAKRSSDPWEPFHVASDLVISDHTSLVAAYALLHRPIYLLPLRDGLFLDGAIVAQLARVAPCLSEASGLRELLERDHADYPMDDIIQIAQHIDSYLGEAEKRIKEEVYEVMDLALPA